MVTNIDKLGDCGEPSPFQKKEGANFITEEKSVLARVHKNEVEEAISADNMTYLELAGPREMIYFNPDMPLACGIVTCGGLCPGINDIIRGLVMELFYGYGVKDIFGFRYGYRGIAEYSKIEPVELTPEIVDTIHTKGGTILSSSRGPQDTDIMVDNLAGMGIKILFTVGGDGTMKGAQDIAEKIKSRGLDIAVIAVPKTIDNDICYVDESFGFETAVQKAADIIENAHIEAKGAPNGVGLVKVMGRTSGFIASYTALANRNVNYCLIPELPFKLDGKGGFLEVLKERLERKEHAVIVVAEGAGQDLMMKESSAIEKDNSGNIRLKDIGSYLKTQIREYFKSLNMEVSLKYIDPSYIIRSVPANAMDSLYCVHLAQCAVHAGITGRTNMLVSHWNGHYVHIPIPAAVKERKKVNLEGRLWKTVMGATFQPFSMFKS
ncbi:ATP-dependent 6-phosphofructokinase [Elusimicrobiota bacterium]